MNNHGFAARLGLGVMILAGNSFIAMRVTGGSPNLVVDTVLIFLSLAGFGVFVWNPKNGEEE